MKVVFMTYTITHLGASWFLYGSRVKLNNGELGYRFFFSKRESGKKHWDIVNEIPDGWEVALGGFLPMLRKKK